MFADKLKKSVLQAAIQGKLTEQLSIKFFARNLPTLVGRGIAILILYIFLYSFFAHIAKSSHIITV